MMMPMKGADDKNDTGSRSPIICMGCLGLLRPLLIGVKMLRRRTKMTIEIMIVRMMIN